MKKPQIVPTMKPGRPRKVIDLQKLERIQVASPNAPEQALQTLLIFDARCLHKETQQELLRLLPELNQVRRAWRAEFMEYGCASCHRKNRVYGAGGFCNACYRRLYARMENRFRKVMEGYKDEMAVLVDALCRRYNAAQRLFNTGDE
jgi:hypothetical protein